MNNEKFYENDVKWMINNGDTRIGYFRYINKKNRGILLVGIHNARKYYLTEYGTLYKKIGNRYKQVSPDDLYLNYKYKIKFDGCKEYSYIPVRSLIARTFLTPLDDCNSIAMIKSTGSKDCFHFNNLCMMTKEEHAKFLMKKMNMDEGCSDEEVETILDRRQFSSVASKDWMQKIINAKSNAKQRAKNKYHVGYNDKLDDLDFWWDLMNQIYYIHPKRLELDKDIKAIAYSRKREYDVDLLMFVPYDINDAFRFVDKWRSKKSMLEKIASLIEREEALGYMPLENIEILKKAYEIIKNN